MAEEHIGPRSETKAPWLKLFSAFKVALDPKKLLLAAAGILAMWLGWWLLALVFYSPRSIPDWVSYKPTDGDEKEAWISFKRARDRWNLIHEMAGNKEVAYDEADVANSVEQYRLLSELSQAKGAEAKEAVKAKLPKGVVDRYQTLVAAGLKKPWGRLRTWPGDEDRGPNPYLLVAEYIGPKSPDKASGTQPEERGQFLGWLIGDQLPTLIEPLMKFLAPIKYMFNKGAGGWNRLYLILVILWTLLVWGYFGGAITRMAAVQLARNEKISMREALTFAKERCQSFFFAPLFPLLFLGILTFILIIFGLFSGLIPVVGDILISGLLWPIVLILGIVMAVVLVGLIGWPLMNPTISTEGSDSFDALSRSYSYVYQAPWHYIAYSIVALLYGAVLVFFVVFMGSLIVYAGQWAVGQAPFLASDTAANDREPTYLFVNAPTSFGWRNLLLHNSPFAEAEKVVTRGGVNTVNYEMSAKYMESMHWYNWVGTFLVSVWIYLFFMLVVGFGYSYFWTASTIIYFLMRRHVDDTDMDEVHVEEEDLEEPFGKESTYTPPPPASPSGDGVTMVEPPVLRTTPSPAPSSTAPLPTASPMSEPSSTPAPAPAGDSNSPPHGTEPHSPATEGDPHSPPQGTP